MFENLTETEQANLTAYCLAESERRNVTPAWVAYELSKDPEALAQAINYQKPEPESE